MQNNCFQKDRILSRKQETLCGSHPHHRRYLGSVFVDLLVRDLPGTALPHLVHRGLVLEAIVQPEGSDQVLEPPDAARQAEGAREGGPVGWVVGCFAGAGGGGRRRGGRLLLRPGFLVDVGEDVDLMEVKAELAQQRDDPAGGKRKHLPKISRARWLWRGPVPAEAETPAAILGFHLGFPHTAITLSFCRSEAKKPCWSPKTHYSKAQGTRGGGSGSCHPPMGTAAVAAWLRGAAGVSGHQHLRLPLFVHPVDLPADEHPDFALCPPLLAPQEVGDEQRETWPQNTPWETRRW